MLNCLFLLKLIYARKREYLVSLYLVIYTAITVCVTSHLLYGILYHSFAGS